MRDDELTPTEAWVWERLKSGERADFGQKLGSELDPGQPQGWGEDRTISAAFLAAITHRPRCEELQPAGVRLSGARVTGDLDLQVTRFAHTFWAEKCRFEGFVDLTLAVLSGSLSFEDSAIAGVNADGLSLLLNGVDVDLCSAARAKLGGGADLVGIHTRRDLNLAGIRTEGPLALQVSRIGGRLLLDGAALKGTAAQPAGPGPLKEQEPALSLSGAHVEGTVDLSNATLTGLLDASGATVKGSVFLSGLTARAFASVKDEKPLQLVDMTALQAGAVYFEGGALLLANTADGKPGPAEGRMSMEGAQIARDVFIRSGARIGDLLAIFARVDGNLDLTGSELHSVDLSAARVGQLRLGTTKHLPPRWAEGARLDLVNCHAGALQDRTDAGGSWPAKLELDGFTYDRLGGFGDDATKTMAERDTAAFISWLEKDASYTPQPYDHLAGALRRAGYAAKADSILFASRERARRTARRRFRSFSWREGWARNMVRAGGLRLSQLLIGYGLGWRLLVLPALWVACMTLIGDRVLDGGAACAPPRVAIAGAAAPGAAEAGAAAPGVVCRDLFKSEAERLAYSFDVLLPVVTLNRDFDQIALNDGPRRYFYLHQIFGFVLGGFLLAGLGGLTQR